MTGARYGLSEFALWRGRQVVDRLGYPKDVAGLLYPFGIVILSIVVDFFRRQGSQVHQELDRFHLDFLSCKFKEPRNRFVSSCRCECG